MEQDIWNFENYHQLITIYPNPHQDIINNDEQNTHN